MDMNLVHVMCVSLWGIWNGDGSDGSCSITKFKGKDWQEDEWAQGPDNLCGTFYWTKREIEEYGVTLTVWYGSKTPIEGWSKPHDFHPYANPQCEDCGDCCHCRGAAYDDEMNKEEDKYKQEQYFYSMVLQDSHVRDYEYQAPINWYDGEIPF